MPTPAVNRQSIRADLSNPQLDLWSTAQPGESSHHEALNFLASLTASDPELAESTLDAEVDALLGRSQARAPAEKVTNEPIVLDDADEGATTSDFAWYSALLATTPRVDSDRAAQAAHHVEVGLLAKERLQSQSPREFSRAELSELHDLVEQGEAEWNWLLLSNLRLVFHWSKGIAHSIDPDWAQDAFQIGFFGLMRGLEKWDHTKGFRVSTYVSWHIRQHIQRWQANDVSIIRLPVHVWDKIARDPESLPPDLAKLVDRSQNVRSLEAMTERGDDQAWDGGISAVEERHDHERSLRTALVALTEKEVDILYRRHGVGDDLPDPQTLDQIGEHYGVTRERIRQIEAKALKRLRENAAVSTPHRGRIE